MVMHGNPWWSQVWTVQESVLPASTVILWGPLIIPWEILDSAATNMCYADDPLIHYQILDDALQKHPDLIEKFLYPVRGLAISRSMEESLDLLQRWRYREATDPRDKVFGLMGLLPQQLFPSI